MGYDVVVVGGGLIGAACADTLAGEGHSVALFEARRFAREASWAGSGILHPIHPWQYPDALHPLLRAAPATHRECAADLANRTGIDVELVESGVVVMGSELDRLAAWCGETLPHQRLDARVAEPSIRVAGDALLLPEACQVRNQRLARAFLEGARRRGAELFENTPVNDLAELDAPHVVLCAGAWAGRLLPGMEVEPVRGQILLYQTEPGTFRRVVIFATGEYLVPRKDGRVLFGSTLERAGFDPRPRPEACARLAGRAHELAGLEPDRLLAAWAGLRPATRSLLPYLGRHPARPGLIVACGHYRNGILLAPLTGRIVADLIAGRDPGVDLARCEPNYED